MTFILAGLTASGLSWILNGLLVDKVGRWWVVVFGPGMEELSKTGIALFLGTNIFLSHLTFGVVEAVRDITGGQPGSWLAGLVSFISHSVFGFMATLSYQKTGSFLFAVIIPLIFHFLWNGVVLMRTGLTGHR
ncbi:MAG: hypothetical protein FH756_05330 [Firmicutes bacterium]|nr:hypothetical protein [Bacillota bacterium]